MLEPSAGDVGVGHFIFPPMQEHDPPPLPSAAQLLTAPAPLAARLLCRAYGSQAAHAADGIDLPGQLGIDARHDLRVALRRLRVTLLAYRLPLEECRPEKLARRAAALARRVGVMRNRDVHRLLLESVGIARTLPQRAVLEQLHQPDTEHVSDAEAVAALRRRWQRFEIRLKAALETWQEAHRLSGQQHALPFSGAAATALDGAASQLERRWAAISGPDDLAAMHSARLAIKAVRYLIAPLADADAGIDTTRKALHAAQSLLGDLNDAWTLREQLRTVRPDDQDTSARTRRLAGTALRAIDRDLTTRISHAFESLADWRSGVSLTETITAVRSLADSWRRGSALPMEYERKWLLSALPPRVRGIAPARLHQGYLPGDVLVERIRSVTTGRATQWFRTVKLGRGIARVEVEEQTSAALGKALFDLTLGKRVTKRRFAVHDGALVWEVDEFTDRELVLVEVELPDATTPVELPAWLTPWVIREVTDEAEFTNWKLAR